MSAATAAGSAAQQVAPPLVSRHGSIWPFLLLAGWVLGSAVQLQQAQLYPWPVYLLVLLTGAGLALLAPRMRRGPAARKRGAWFAALLSGMLIGFALVGLRSAHYLARALPPELEGQDIELVARVTRMPQQSEIGVRLTLRPEAAWLNGAPVELPARVLVGWYGGSFPGASINPNESARPSAQVLAGDRWRFTVRIKAPHGQVNPHGFDYELWLWEQGVQAVGTVRLAAGATAPKRLETSWLYPVERLRQGVRDAAFERLDERRLAGVIAALVAGDQNAIERADWDVFRATGVAHLMSISGLHITMFAWLAFGLSGWLWRRSPRLCLLAPAQHAALFFCLLLAAAYAFFSGWGVPAQRTILMLATMVVLRWSGRRWPWPYVWLLACAVVVAVDPWALLQAGFWLSFVAVAVLFASGRGAADAPAGIGSRLLAMLREQWVITLALTPLSLLLFQQVSVVGLLANLVAIPWVTLLITPLSMLGALLPVLWDGAAWAVRALSWYLQFLVEFPLVTVSTPAAPLWAGIAAVAGGVMMVLRWPLALRLAGLVWVVPVLLWPGARPAHGEFEVLAADVGQGNALIVRTAAHTLVYDAGPRYSLESDAGQRVLVPLLRALGDRVDLLLLSHRDSDHTGGAAAVLKMQPQALLLSSLEPEHELHRLRAAARCHDAAEGGQAWQWDGVRFEVLSPRSADYDGLPRSNALSCVLRISNPRSAALLTGDIEAAQELSLVQRRSGTGAAGRSGLQADLLLVPHHGSKTSSSAALLAAVQPSLALVQSGYRNRFGHPADSVMQRYRDLGVPVFDSPRCGAALWRSSEPASVSCQRQVQQRYWLHRLP